jgi:small conductance mechanosensitive channel
MAVSIAMQHFWQMYFDTGKAIIDTFGAAGYPILDEPVRMRTAA